MHRKSFQILVQSPDLQIHPKSVTGDETLSDLKHSFFPNSQSSFYFTLNGKPLSDDTNFSTSGIAPLSTLVLQSRLRGGGGDGGSTCAESRDCYLKMYAEKKPDKVDPNEQRLSKWQNCALSNEPLREPCVIDKLGNIFNKESLVEALLGKKLPKEFGYIKGLKDMIKIKLESVPGEDDGAKFRCPVAGLEFNGKYKFFALRNCGHVLSAKALKEVKSSACLVCHEEFGEGDKIVINGNEEEVEVLRERMEEEKAKVREKKTKKVKNNDSEAVNGLSLEASKLSGTKHDLTVEGRLNVVRKSGKSQAKEKQLIYSSDEVNQNKHSKTEEFAQFEGVNTRKNQMLASLNHQNDVPQSEQQIHVGSHVEYPISYGRMGKSLPKDTLERRTRLSVRKSGKAQAEELLIHSSNEVNQNSHRINVECAHCGGGTRENLMVASLSHQNHESQSEQQIQVGSLPKDTVGRRIKFKAVGKGGKAHAKEKLIDSSNVVNQNDHRINKKCAQLGGDTRENLMVASPCHQNHESQSEQQIQVGRRAEYPISFGRIGQSLPKDTMGRYKRLNAVRKSGKAQAEDQLIDSSKAVNQNNYNISEKCAQSGGVSTRRSLMVASLNHQNGQSQSEQVQVGSHVESPTSFGRMSKRLLKDTNERNKRPNVVRKSGRLQAEKQLIDSSIEVNQNNHNINEECDQFVGDTRGNPVVASPNLQSDQSQSEQQIPVENHVETPNSVSRMSKSLTKGQKRVRGYTRMSDVWNLPDGEFICVEVDTLGNPIGWEGKKLLNALGCLVRKHEYAPINILSWKDMPELNITNMFEWIQSKFHFVPELTEQTKQILKDNLSAKWRQFKHDLKAKGYDENKTEEEMAAYIPDRRVDPSQYRALVHHWCSKEGKKISNINKRNRSKYEDFHCMGTKSLPRFIHETTEANGAQPSRAEIYIETRTRKDGSIVNEKAANVIGELKKHMVEATSSRTPQKTQDSTNWENDVYSRVRGPERKGSVRCLGKVPRHSSGSSRRSNVENRVHKLENLLGNLVSVLQTRFSADEQINDVLQAIAQEVPNAPSTPNDFSSKDQPTTSDSDWEN